MMGSLVGYMSYVWLLSVRPPSIVGTYAYVNPVVAVFLGWLMLGEVIGKNQILALCIILAGVVLVSLPKKGKGQHLKYRGFKKLIRMQILSPSTITNRVYL
jgi:drug/metabolite transporter (DMT)-like permease